MTPSTTPFRVGEVVSVEFLFADMQGRKRRPGLVLASDPNDLLLARITTQQPRNEFDVPLADWAAIGLPKASTARLLKLVAIDVRLVHHSIGLLSVPDRATLATAVERLGIDIAGQLRLV
ncbi:MAG: type II toxin-antitoxin system PemK/MazF family toxin [Pirellulales bacterium]